jgi:ferredoxin
MKVWIDRKQCQGSELCTEFAGAVIKTDDQYIAYLPDAADPDGGESDAVEVPVHLIENVLTAAKQCPSQCIHTLDQP